MKLYKRKKTICVVISAFLFALVIGLLGVHNDLYVFSAPDEYQIEEKEISEEQINKILSGMSLEEKVYQMFIITPEQLTGEAAVTIVDEVFKERLQKYPVGGLIYCSANLESPDQTKEMLLKTQEYAQEAQGMPLFLCVDEEGGAVARIGNNKAFHVKNINPMQKIKTEKKAYKVGVTIGSYLSELGFNVDFAPVADVITNSTNTVIGNRSFGSNPNKVAALAVAVSDGLHAENVMSTFKHFPGHGGTEGDTHEGFAYTDKSYEKMKEAELLPFAVAEANGVDFVMVAHIAVPNVTGDDTPCSLSREMVTGILRNDLGYNGLIITDALNMGAISQIYSAEEAAVMAVQAGVDVLLMPQDFQCAYEGIIKAVESGEISEEQINASVKRIIRTKL